MRLEASVVVNRPIDEVWTFRTNFFNVPRLTGMLLEVRQTSPGPLGLGSTLRSRMVLLGLEIRGRGTVTEWDPPHKVTYSWGRVRGMGSLSLRQIYDATAEGTRVVSSQEMEEPGPIVKLLWPILGPSLRRQFHAAEQQMKRLLEEGRGG